MSRTRSVSPACAERAANPMTRAIAVVPALRDRPARTLGGGGKSRDIAGSAQDLEGRFLRLLTLPTGRQRRLVSRWGSRNHPMLRIKWPGCSGCGHVVGVWDGRLSSPFARPAV